MKNLKKAIKLAIGTLVLGSSLVGISSLATDSSCNSIDEPCIELDAGECDLLGDVKKDEEKLKIYNECIKKGKSEAYAEMYADKAKYYEEYEAHIQACIYDKMIRLGFDKFSANMHSYRVSNDIILRLLYNRKRDYYKHFMRTFNFLETLGSRREMIDCYLKLSDNVDDLLQIEETAPSWRKREFKSVDHIIEHIFDENFNPFVWGYGPESYKFPKGKSCYYKDGYRLGIFKGASEEEADKIGLAYEEAMRKYRNEDYAEMYAELIRQGESKEEADRKAKLYYIDIRYGRDKEDAYHYISGTKYVK